MSEATGFLYPFIESDETDADTLLAGLAASARAKAATSSALQQATVTACAEQISQAGREIAARVRAGGRMYTFGNGGSATDAATWAALFATPPSGRPVPARCLAADQAVLTALGNDVGFELVFARQLIAHGRAQDIAVALSTSGNSDDLMTGLAQARKQGMFTIGLAGYDGGSMATSPDVDLCLVVSSQSVHRIQESQALLGYQVFEATQQALQALGGPNE